jgi:hypothetical protein
MATVHRTDFGFRNDAMSTTQPGNGQPSSPSDSRMEYALNQIRDALRGLRFGNVVVLVQDGVVVQIERTEKRRLSKPGSH